MAKAYTDLEQSRKLAEFLPLDSADMVYIATDYDDNGEPLYTASADYKSEYIWEDNEVIHCWSLAALFDVLPEGVIDDCYVPNLQKENGKYSIAYGDEELLCIADNPIDTCYEMIMKLHEQKLL